MILKILFCLLFLVSSTSEYATSICSKEQFKCRNEEKCISRSWRCDGDGDCPLGSDEEYCDRCDGYDCLIEKRCPSEYFRCNNHHCIPEAWWCDGIIDCADGKDEKNCLMKYCETGEKFKCLNMKCIPKDQVCNKVDDCKDGSDERDCVFGIMAVESIKDVRHKALRWLKLRRTREWGWEENTHRAIIALYLSGNTTFNSSLKDEELMAKQLELKLSIALLRNETDPISPNQLAMYINALLVVCHNPRNFYGYDLITTLKRQANFWLNVSHPLISLTLCNANEAITEDEVEDLFNILLKTSEYSFWTDIQAMAVMALTCITTQSEYLHLAQNISVTTDRFKQMQQEDGSFGNIYTTAVVLQALLANGHEEDSDWDLQKAMEFVHNQQWPNGSFGDFLSTYLILPVLNAQSLAKIHDVKCQYLRRQARHEKTIEEIWNTLGPKTYVQYSLWIGNEKEVMHSLSLRVPSNITVLEVMKLAAEADNKYKYEAKNIGTKLYVYSISEIANDPEDGKFWLLYRSRIENNRTAEQSSQSPEATRIRNGEHIIMWYKTVHLWRTR